MIRILILLVFVAFLQEQSSATQDGVSCDQCTKAANLMMENKFLIKYYLLDLNKVAKEDRAQVFCEEAADKLEEFGMTLQECIKASDEVLQFKIEKLVNQESTPDEACKDLQFC